MIAFADGKLIQTRRLLKDEPWREFNVSPEGWDMEHWEYRPKPEPVTRPWNNSKDIPGPICWLQEKSQTASACLVTSIGERGVTYVVSNAVQFLAWTAEDNWRRLLYSTDLRNFKPCTVEVQP